MMRFIILILFLACPLFADMAQASDSYTIANGSTVDITAHSVCRRVANASGQSLYVPTVNSGEWSNFYGTSHTNVTVSSCPPACGGSSVGGYCWYFGAGGQSCDTVCTSHGGCNLTGTRDYAGSGGTLANCNAVLTALGQGSSAIDEVPLSAESLGCGKFGSLNNFVPHLMRDYNYATTCAASSPGSGGSFVDQRACACTN